MAQKYVLMEYSMGGGILWWADFCSKSLRAPCGKKNEPYGVLKMLQYSTLYGSIILTSGVLHILKL